ncbi:MAG TPA: GNAT family N-acetyltransferase [Solirubrobacteraceae bacterium]|nr:GNAT family N-acetyltransferase [Solirubrobacteraceae bacterium]
MSGELDAAATAVSRDAGWAGGGAAAARRWHVRPARPEDASVVAEAVRELLLELGGAPPAQQAMSGAAGELISDPGLGAVLVADAGGELVGVLAASWQVAVHAPGRYALIQDLWVDPAWRNHAIGRELLDALFALARERGCRRVEVGLPRESFARFAATEGFYLANGFEPNGPRMRRAIA